MTIKLSYIPSCVLVSRSPTRPNPNLEIPAQCVPLWSRAVTDDLDKIRSYYDQYLDGEDSRLDRHQLERDITLRYLEAYLPSTGHILEIGAATGTYTLWLAQRGYHV